MAESQFCGGCLRNDEAIAGDAWCCDCAELVCKTCSDFHKKLSPPHKVNPVEKVSNLSSSLQTLSRNCEIHDEKIVLFCCQHDQLICYFCFSESHQSCKPVMPIEKAAQGAQQGTTVTGLEQRIDSLTQTMEKIVDIFNTQISNLSDKTMDFKKTFGDIRRKFMSYLDKLEADFNQEIDSKYKECNATLLKSKSEIQSKCNRLTTWKKDMASLKHYTSNIQLFHVIKYLDAKTHKEETEFRKFKKDAAIPSLNSTCFKPAEIMSNIRATLPSIGDLSIDNITIASSPDLDIDQQGQAFVNSEVTDKRPSLVTLFKTSVLGNRIARACFVPDNKLLLCGSYKVYVCDHHGSNTNTICLDYDPCDVTLYDRNTALVSVQVKGIQILDMRTLKPGKRIKVGSKCNGITSLNKKIWVRTDDRTLTMIDIKGKVLKKLTTSFDPYHICLHKDGDIYCTAYSSKVYIVTSDGVERVVYRSPDLSYTYGITVDDHGDVYIAGWKTHTIHRISSDGQQTNIVLTEEDAIEYPRGLSFNPQTKELMVISKDGSCVNIYKVS